MKYANGIQKQRLLLAKPSIDENPRNYTAELGTSIYSSGGKGMVDKAVIGGIIERYREMLRERDEDLLREMNELPLLSTEEVVRIYEALLVDLTINSKPIITDLTILAGEQREHGEGIADVISCRIAEAPVDLKLPSLYLLDSIVKNIGCEYIDYFSARLPEVYLEAYRQVDPSMNPALRHLFRTWSKVFPDFVLQKIDAQLQLFSESPRLSHGIHVNPKYVEARHQSEHDSDRQRARVAFSRLRSYGQLSIPSDSYDLNRSDVVKAEERTVTASGRAGRASPNMRANRYFTKMDGMRIEPEHRQGRSNERDVGTTEWWRTHSSDRTFPKLDSLAYNEPINPRALIDAYGSDRGEYNKSNWQDRPKALIDAYGSDRGTDRQPQWQDNQLTNGHLNESISNKVAARSWKNTEEVEYDWEDMSPPLADGNRNTYLESSLQPQGNSFRARYDPGVLGLSSDSGRVSNWSTSFPASVLIKGTTGNMPAHQDLRLHSDFQPSQSLFNSNGRGNIQQPSSYVLPSQKQFGKPNLANVGDNGSNDSHILPEQRFDASLNNVLPSQLQFPNQHPGYVPNKQPNQMPAAKLTPQYMTSQEGHENYGPTSSTPRLNYLGTRPLHHGYMSQGNTGFASNGMPNVMPGACFPNTAPPRQPFMGGASLSASAPRPGLPSLLQTSGYPQNMGNHAAGSDAFSGLISSLMSQGLISLENQQDSVGVNFNPDTLKTRHDSAIKALYTDLPRQCTTCGLRFNDQELHRNHMDWHVTKNRMNKNRKQKASRKWFASASMWLSGAEASGPEAVPGFLPSEIVVENQDDEEIAVPADEEQTTCGLCGEPFDDFYSHETDEWMYRGAVYLNVNSGSRSIAGLDRSQLGPVVHAKCRPDPVTSSSQNVATNIQSFDVDGSQRKRLRVS